jgi:hypothetical protein
LRYTVDGEADILFDRRVKHLELVSPMTKRVRRLR